MKLVNMLIPCFLRIHLNIITSHMPRSTVCSLPFMYSCKSIVASLISLIHSICLASHMYTAQRRVNNKVLSEHLRCHAKCWGLRQTLSEHCNHSLPQSVQIRDALWAGVSVLETLPALLQNHGGWCNVWPERLYSVRIYIILMKTLLNLLSLRTWELSWIYVEIYSKEPVS